MSVAQPGASAGQVPSAPKSPDSAAPGAVGSSSSQGSASSASSLGDACPAPPADGDFDLGKVTVEDVWRTCSPGHWRRDFPDTITACLVSAAPELALATLLAYFSDPQRCFDVLFSEFSSAQAKAIAARVGAPLRSKVRKEAIPAAIKAVVQRHMSKFPHLVNVNMTEVDARMLRQVASVPSEDGGSRSGSDAEEETAPVPSSAPRRSLPPRAAKDAKVIAAASAPSGAGGRGRVLPPAKMPSDVLAALGKIPDDPADSATSEEERRRPRAHKAKGHHGKRRASKRERAESSSDSASDSGSDSDSRAKRKHGRRQRHAHSSTPADDSSSSSSSSSSPTESGSDSEDFSSRKSRKRGVEDGMEQSGLSKPLARKFLRNLERAAGSSRFSVLALYKERDVKQTRNRREMEFLARTVDLLRRKEYGRVLEAVVRRLVGVETADRSGNWKLCDAFELITEKQSFVPDDFLARALKTVKRIEAIEGNSGRNKHTSSGGDRSGGQNRRSQYKSSPDGGQNGAARDRSASRGPTRPAASDPSKSARDASKDSRGPK